MCQLHDVTFEKSIILVFIFTRTSNLKCHSCQLSSRLLVKMLAMLQEEQASLIEQHQLRLAAQRKEHVEELQQLRTLHHRDLEEAHKQHSDMLEHLKRAHVLESDALHEASSYKRYGIYSFMLFQFIDFRQGCSCRVKYLSIPSFHSCSCYVCVYSCLNHLCISSFMWCLYLVLVFCVNVIIFDYLQIPVSATYNVSM
jgi:hypothetical protein